MRPGPSPRVTGRLVGGGIMLGLGVLFLLDNFGIVDAGDVFRYWPLILLGLGVTRLIAPGRAEERVGGIVLTLLGGVFLLRALHVPWFRLRTIWPLVLVVLGAGLIWQALRGRKSPLPGLPENPREGALAGVPAGLSAAGGSAGGPQEAGSVLKEFALMGGGEVVVRGQDFRGGEVTAIMGGFEVDLRSAGIGGDSATIEVFTLFGGVEFKVPQEWNVVV
ncbi:MAG: LiaI-LiaF-like domain-containing protein, partial [Thermoanaerobaculia bacterium]